MYTNISFVLSLNLGSSAQAALTSSTRNCVELLFAAFMLQVSMRHLSNQVEFLSIWIANVNANRFWRVRKACFENE